MRTEMTHWQCNRCDVVFVTEARNPDGAMKGLPMGWGHIDKRGSVINGGDLCDRCVDEYRSWWHSAGGSNPDSR